MGHYSDQYDFLRKQDDAREKMARKIHEENMSKRRERMIAFIQKDLEARSLPEILADILSDIGKYRDISSKV
jgi:hypothetical protein